MYKRLGLSNEAIVFYTSWLYLPWVIKPFWSPIVDLFRTKRWWILAMQFVIGASLAGIAFTLPGDDFVRWSLAFFWLMAFGSATHDIAADGYYMLELNEHEQALYVGIRSTFYRIATIAGQFLLITFAGIVEAYTRVPVRAWTITFALAAGLFLLLFAFHAFLLPRPDTDRPATGGQTLIVNFFATFRHFFLKRHIWVAIAFMLLYRLPEALLSKICPLFLLDTPDQGGLGLSTPELGLVQGLGIVGLTLGGVLGGIAISRGGFNRWLWPMALSISLPNAVYIFLAYFQTDNLLLTILLINIEQFGYGFGFTAYMLYLIYFSQGENKTAHYAFCTGFMALSMMLPGLVAGWLQETVGYLNFFIIVMGLVPVTFLVSLPLNVTPGFGSKDFNAEAESATSTSHPLSWSMLGRYAFLLLAVLAIIYIYCR